MDFFCSVNQNSCQKSNVSLASPVKNKNQLSKQVSISSKLLTRSHCTEQNGETNYSEQTSLANPFSFRGNEASNSSKKQFSSSKSMTSSMAVAREIHKASSI